MDERSKQATTTLQATCLHLYRFCKCKNILLQVHSLDLLSVRYKKPDKAGNGIQKEFSQSCAKRIIVVRRYIFYKDLLDNCYCKRRKYLYIYTYIYMLNR